MSELIHRVDPMTLPLTPHPRSTSTAPIRYSAVYESGGQTHGVWEAEPGVHRDYQGQETVLILAGRATITGHERGAVDVAAGDLVVIDAGQKVTWTVHEKIRKVYVVNR